jgi:hypothetical protein
VAAKPAAQPAAASQEFTMPDEPDEMEMEDLDLADGPEPPTEAEELQMQQSQAEAVRGSGLTMDSAFGESQVF